MRIGIDAKWLFEGPPSGRRVVRALTEAMIRIGHEHEFVLFLDRKYQGHLLPIQLGDHVTCSWIWAGNNLLSNVFVLPIAARTHKVDVILFQNFISPWSNARKVAYIHDVLFLSHPQFYTWKERLYFSPLKWLTQKADAVITVSEEEKKRLIRYMFASPEKISVAYHGVTDTFRPLLNHETAKLNEIRKMYGLPERFILFVGRLNIRKNVENLLRALPQMADQQTRVVITGGEDWKKSNHAVLIKELKLENRLIQTGPVEEGLEHIYALSEVFCFPSHAESFGLPPLEAMASGIPVIVSSTTSLPEICGSAALYINPDRPAEIADRLDKLLSDAEMRNELSRKGRERASQFTWKAAAEKVLQVLALKGKLKS